jgi:hypothetical protein
MADLRRRTALDQKIVKIRIADSEVDALRQEGYLEAGAPVQEAIEAYSDVMIFKRGIDAYNNPNFYGHRRPLFFLCRRLWLLPSVETEPPSNV